MARASSVPWRKEITSLITVCEVFVRLLVFLCDGAGSLYDIADKEQVEMTDNVRSRRPIVFHRSGLTV